MDKRLESRDFASILRRITKNIGLLLGAMGTAMAFGFVTAALNARALGVVDLGVITLFQVAANLVSGVFYMGSQQPMIKLGRQALEQGDRNMVGQLAGLSLFADTLAAVLGGLTSIALLVFTPDLLALESKLIAPALFYTIVVFTSGTAVSNGIFRLFDSFRYIGIFQVFTSASILFSSVYFFFTDAPVEYYLYANASIHAILSVAQNLLAIRILSKAKCSLRFGREIFGWNFLKTFLSYAWTTNATSTLDILVRQSDALLLNYFFGVGTVGVYGVVKQVGGVLNKLFVPISSAVFPEVATLAAKGDRVSAYRLMRRLTGFGLAIGLCGALLMLVCGQQILGWGFGPEFVDGYIPLLVMMFAVSLRLTYATMGSFVQSFYTPEKLFVIYVAGFIAYFAVAPGLIYSLGMTGAAISQAVFLSTLLAYSWTLLVRRLREPIPVEGSVGT